MKQPISFCNLKVAEFLWRCSEQCGEESFWELDPFTYKENNWSFFRGYSTTFFIFYFSHKKQYWAIGIYTKFHDFLLIPLKFQRKFSLYIRGQKNSAVRCRRKFQEGYPYTGKNIKMIRIFLFWVCVASTERIRILSQIAAF